MGLGRTIKKAYMKGKKKAYGSKGVKGRYIRPGFTKGMTNLIKDVEMIKGRLNVEKKFVDTDLFTDSFGQCEINVEGALTRDISPIIPQGITESTRNGNSVKLTGLSMPVFIRGQASCYGGRKIRLTILKVRTADNNVSADEAFERVWDVNPINGTLRDYHAPRAYRNSKTDGISVAYSKTFYLPKAQLDTGLTGMVNTEQPFKCFRVNVKLDDVLRFDTNASTLPGGFKYILVMQSDAGNFNAGANSTLDVPILDANSGMTVSAGCRYWFVDN